MFSVSTDTLVALGHFFVSATLLAALWFLLAEGLARLVRLRSPSARILLFVVPVLAAFGSRVRLSGDATIMIIAVCLSVAITLFLFDVLRYHRFVVAQAPDLQPSAHLQKIVDALAVDFRMKVPPAAYELATAGAGPYIIGLWRPALIMPSAILKVLDHEETRALIAHELAHVHRRDALGKWVLLFLRRLAFLNPAAYWAHRRIGLETERACDLLAMGVTGMPGTLARALVKVEEYLAHSTSQSPVSALATIPRADSHLSQRVRSIADYGTRVEDVTWLSIFKLLGIFAVFSAVCLRPGGILLALIG